MTTVFFKLWFSPNDYFCISIRSFSISAFLYFTKKHFFASMFCLFIYLYIIYFHTFSLIIWASNLFPSFLLTLVFVLVISQYIGYKCPGLKTVSDAVLKSDWTCLYFLNGRLYWRISGMTRKICHVLSFFFIT